MEEERLLIDLSSPLGENASITLLGPPPASGAPTLINSRQSWTTFDDDDDDQNNAFSRYHCLKSKAKDIIKCWITNV